MFSPADIATISSLFPHAFYYPMVSVYFGGVNNEPIGTSQDPAVILSNCSDSNMEVSRHDLEKALMTIEPAYESICGLIYPQHDIEIN